MKSSIRILIADDHHLVRMGLRAVMENSPDIEIVGEAASLEELQGIYPNSNAGIILLDIRFPRGDSFHLCKQIKESHPEKKVLFLTAHPSDDHVMKSIDAGGDGFLLKDIEPSELIRSIRDLHIGKSILDPSITARVFARLKQPPAPDPIAVAVEPLAPQEKRVLRLVSQGLTNKEIAESMKLSDKTVKNYLSNAMDKLGLTRRTQAAVYFIRNIGE